MSRIIPLVVHEILHVLGFGHTSSFLSRDSIESTAMSPVAGGLLGTQHAGEFGWPTDGSGGRLNDAIDPCTKKGMSLADGRY